MPSLASLHARAPAKVNLTLHVLARRAEDGFHVLESLVAFAGVGDTLALRPGPGLTLSVSGPTAGPAGPGDDNLVTKAARALERQVPGLRLGAFRLAKHLPVAAGIGGGSSDAAAALRLLAQSNGLAGDDPALFRAAGETGADVPVCLVPHARMMRGAGETLGPALALPRLPAVLVNPGVPVSTAPVFKALGLAAGHTGAFGPDHPQIPAGIGTSDLLARVAAARNDLEKPALTLAPAIGEVLASLRTLPGCRLARMSGSGATCFALFEDRTAAESAGRALAAARPGWWVRATVLH